MTLKVGLLCGREWSFPSAFLDEVNRRNSGVVAEYARLGGTQVDEPCPYAVLIDRISHEVPYYRSYLKNAVLQGTTVINNPFMWTADDRFFEASLAARLGVAHPKTIVLPNKDYVPSIVPSESLRNLVYPLDWQGIIDHVGLPCVLRDAQSVRKHVAVCHSLDELLHHYNQSGLATMIVQEFIEWKHYVRCLCLGQEEVLPIRYDPVQGRQLVEDDLPRDVRQHVIDDTLKLMRALGYDLCSAEWGVRDGVPHAIDFLNPAPDMDINSLTPSFFKWAVKHTAELAIKKAISPRPQNRELRWSAWF
jgi:hypothetical protein